MIQKIKYLEDVQLGDKVTLKVPDYGLTLVGPASLSASTGKKVVAVGQSDHGFVSVPIDEESFVIAEREVPELPTKPGAYSDQDGKIVALLPSIDDYGEPWRAINFQWQESDTLWGSDTQVLAELALPLTPLVSEASVVKQIIDWLSNKGWCDEPGSIIDDIRKGIANGDWKAEETHE